MLLAAVVIVPLAGKAQDEAIREPISSHSPDFCISYCIFLFFKTANPYREVYNPFARLIERLHTVPLPKRLQDLVTIVLRHLVASHQTELHHAAKGHRGCLTRCEDNDDRERSKAM